jgi:phosphatidylglycerophosphate synthase
MMSEMREFIKKSDCHIRPNSFISLIDNKIALVFIFFLRKIRFLSPNKLSLISFGFFLLAIGLLFGRQAYFCVFFLFVAYTFDNVDGIWARLFNQTSVLGAWLDCTLDRLKDITSLLIITWFYPENIRWSVVCLFVYLLYLMILLNSKTYLALAKKAAVSEAEKRYRLIAFGPADFYILISGVILLPGEYKIGPLGLLILAIFILVLRELNEVRKFFGQKDSAVN